MKLERVFYFLLMFTILVALFYSIILLNIIETNQEIRLKPNQITSAVAYSSFNVPVSKDIHRLRKIHFDSFKREDLKEDFIRIHTKNWRGKVGNIRFIGFDDRLHKGRNFYLDNSEAYKEFLDKYNK